jgi:ABC-2 type transport system ATP-binding protein
MTEGVVEARPTPVFKPAKDGWIPDGTPVIHCVNAIKRFYEDAQPGDTQVVARGLTRKKKREVLAVDHVSFDAYRGEVLGILGANGSGKSTLIRLISTLLFPDDGTVEVFGLNVLKHPHEIRKRINRVSVEASFFKKLSALENLMFAGRLYGLSVKETRARVYDILVRLGFSESKVKASLENMSRGQQQKVSIARAFMTYPELLLLDEPTTGLDPKSRRDVQDFVEEFKAKRNTTIILTTHDMAEAERLCDRIAILDGGKLIALDTPENLKKMAGPDIHTFEDVFFAFVGRDWKEVITNDESD